MADHALANVVAEETLKEVLVDRQRVLRKDRVAEFLELVEDLVIQARIVVIGATEHHDADAVFAFELINHFAGAAADRGFVLGKRFETGLYSAVIFFEREAEDRLPR